MLSLILKEVFECKKFDKSLFKNSTKLVGGAGTTYDATPYSGNGDDMEYLRIDDPAHDNPGYLTSAN